MEDERSAAGQTARVLTPRVYEDLPGVRKRVRRHRSARVRHTRLPGEGLSQPQEAARGGRKL